MIQKIVSGGQTGADRAALDWAISCGIPHGGWCPQGRRAEDGQISARYDLRETGSTNYLQRTEQNVIDSDGTVIFSIQPVLSGGSKRTADFAKKHRKPFLHLHPGIEAPAKKLSAFVHARDLKVLNVAGPRLSGEPTIEEFVTTTLTTAHFG